MARRGQNEGSIYRRKDGRWCAVVTLGYEAGKLRRKSYYGKTRKSVQARLTRALRDVEEGLPLAGEKLTIGTYLDRWLDESAKPTVRPKTYSSYRDLVRLHIKPQLGRIPVGKLTPQHVQNFLNERRRTGLSARTVSYIRSVLSRALNQAVRWNMVPRNVAALVDPPKFERPQIAPLSPEDARTFLKAVKGHRLEALFTVALALGLRKGEALGLRWSDIELEAKTLRVSGAMQRIDGNLVRTETKNDRSRRTLRLPEMIIAALRTHRAHQLEERLAAGDEWKDADFVFTTRIGTPLDGRNVLRYFKKALKDADLADHRFHDLRHSCATLLLAQGVAPRIVMEILGHSGIRVTMDIYSHVMLNMLDGAAVAIDQVLAT